MGKRTLSREAAAQAIYLDFEGEGKRFDGTVPVPHMAGLYRPYLGGYKYSALFFRESWKPVMSHHSVSLDKCGDFTELLEMLINEAEVEGRSIIYWTIHEESMIERHAPELFDRFLAVGLNLKKPAKTYVNRYKLGLDATEKKGLNQYLKVMKTSSPLIVECKPTAAEACRRLDAYAAKKKRWRTWTGEQKRIAKDLLRYNKDDCLGVLRIARKLANANK